MGQSHYQRKRLGNNIKETKIKCCKGSCRKCDLLRVYVENSLRERGDMNSKLIMVLENSLKHVQTPVAVPPAAVTPAAVTGVIAATAAAVHISSTYSLSYQTTDTNNFPDITPIPILPYASSNISGKLNSDSKL